MKVRIRRKIEMKTMDTNHHHLLLLLLFLLFPLNFVSQSHAHEYHSIGKEKVTTLHFFYQETLKGDHPSAIVVAGPKDNIVNNIFYPPFGTVLVIDDPLTEGPDPNSKVVGRAQGLAVYAGQEKLLLVFAMDFVFTSGELNGSSISVLSRNTVLETEREVAVVGGRGKFRLARGFAKLRLHYSNDTSGVIIVKYTVTVFHYEFVV